MNTNIATALIVLALLGAGLLIYLKPVDVPAGSTAPGLRAAVATTSNPTVTTTAALVFATSTCVARTITTYAAPIMLTFTDAQGKVPTGLFGALQPASTTVVYDSGQYGCGAYKVYSFATQAITVSESQ